MSEVTNWIPLVVFGMRVPNTLVPAEDSHKVTLPKGAYVTPHLREYLMNPLNYPYDQTTVEQLAAYTPETPPSES